MKTAVIPPSRVKNHLSNSQRLTSKDNGLPEIAKERARLDASNSEYEQKVERERIETALKLLGPYIVAVIVHPESEQEGLLLQGSNGILRDITKARVGGVSAWSRVPQSTNGQTIVTRVYDCALVEAYKERNPNYTVKTIHVEVPTGKSS